jgi:hypothetical protein
METNPISSAKLNDLEPNFFVPDPSLIEEIQPNFDQPEIEEGVYLESPTSHEMIEIKTKHTTYLIENFGKGQVLISGHPEYCPHPVLVDVFGSTWGGTMLKPGFIGRDMHLEFFHPRYGVVQTSRIREIRRACKGTLSRV